MSIVSLFDKHFSSVNVADELKLFSQSVVNTVVKAISIQVPYLECKPGEATVFHMWKGREVLPTLLPFQAEAGDCLVAASWEYSVTHAAVVLSRFEADGVYLSAEELIDKLDELACAKDSKHE